MNGTLRLVRSVPDAFAELVAEGIAAAVGSPYGRFLSGGGTALECYQALAARGDISWAGVDIFLGDERCVPLDDPDSNHRMINETLVELVGPVHSDHPMYRSGSPEDAAASYQDLVAALPRFDLVHLGLGPDGHCASLFPGSTALDDQDPAHLVVANRDPNGVNPHDRITLTLAGIAQAERTIFTVAGASKRNALGRIRGGEDLPAGRVTGADVIWLVDAEALGDLEPDQVG